MSDEPNAATPIGPDGTPFDSGRWDSYVQHTKAEKEELKQRLQSESSVWEDEQAFLARVAEKFPHMLGDEEEEDSELPEVDEDDPVAPMRSKLEAIEAWQAQVESERGQARFENDLKTEIGDEKIPAKVTDWIRDRTAALGNNSKALKQAVEEYREFAGELRGPQRKPTPTPPQPGKAAEQDYNASKDPNARRAARRARIAAQVEAGMQQQ